MDKIKLNQDKVVESSEPGDTESTLPKFDFKSPVGTYRVTD